MKKLIFVRNGKLHEYKVIDCFIKEKNEKVIVRVKDDTSGWLTLPISFKTKAKARGFLIRHKWVQQYDNGAKISGQAEELYDMIVNVEPDYLATFAAVIRNRNSVKGLAAWLRDNYGYFGRFNSIKLSKYLLNNYWHEGAI